MSNHRRRQVIAWLVAGLPVLSLARPIAAQEVTPDDLSGRHRSPHTKDPDVLGQIEDLAQTGDASARDRAIDFVEHHPDADHPMMLMPLITALQGRGDVLQAAFWFFVWRIRIYPWWLAGDMEDKTSSPSLDATFSDRFIPWLESDPGAARELMLRASDFEIHAPIFPRHPDWVSKDDWSRFVAEGRARRRAAATALTPAKIQAAIEARKKGGLYVGPLRAPGAALPEAWR